MFPVFTDFVKKTCENVATDFFQFETDGDGKKPLETVITNFFNLHMNKGKAYTFKNSKKFAIHKATIYSWTKKIEEKD